MNSTDCLFIFIQGVGYIFGQLQMKNLKILSVETRRLSEFDLDCDQLKAMCISFGARPNIVGLPHKLNCLSTKLLLFEDTFEYLRKLLGQCASLSTIGFEYPTFLKFTLKELNARRISLPLLTVIKLERPQFLQDLKDDLVGCLIQYQSQIEPERLQFILNDESISLEQLNMIVQIHQKFSLPGDHLSTPYLKFLRENETLTELSCLLSSISKLVLTKDGIEPDQDLVAKLKHLQVFSILPGSPPIDEMLFRKMLTTWTGLERLFIYNLGGQVSQRLLDQMPAYWPNLNRLVLDKKPENLKFVKELKNLRSLDFGFNFSKEEIMCLVQACPFLYYVCFYNETTNFENVLKLKMRWKYAKYQKVFSKRYYSAINRYTIEHYRSPYCSRSSYTCEFESLEQMIDHYFDKDLYNAGVLESNSVNQWMYDNPRTMINIAKCVKVIFKVATRH